MRFSLSEPVRKYTSPRVIWFCSSIVAESTRDAGHISTNITMTRMAGAACQAVRRNRRLPGAGIDAGTGADCCCRSAGSVTVVSREGTRSEGFEIDDEDVDWRPRFAMFAGQRSAKRRLSNASR